MRMINLTRFGTLVAALGLITACSTAISESSEKIIVDGEAFNLRTRTYERSGGTFESTAVQVGYTWVQCLKDSPNDCARKVREQIEFRRNGI